MTTCLVSQRFVQDNGTQSTDHDTILQPSFISLSFTCLISSFFAFLFIYLFIYFGGTGTNVVPWLDLLNVLVSSWVLTSTHTISFFQSQSLISVSGALWR